MDKGLGAQEQKREWLRRVIADEEGTQTAIAKRLSMTPARLSGLINGHKGITDKTIDHVSKTLGVAPPMSIGYRRAGEPDEPPAAAVKDPQEPYHTPQRDPLLAELAMELTKLRRELDELRSELRGKRTQ